MTDAATRIGGTYRIVLLPARRVPPKAPALTWLHRQVLPSDGETTP